MRLLKEIYKTYEGARKRAAFENGLARSEYERGYKAKRYQYSILEENGAYRVQRGISNNPTESTKGTSL
jgi:hypothetical protein